MALENPSITSAAAASKQEKNLCRSPAAERLPAAALLKSPSPTIFSRREIEHRAIHPSSGRWLTRQRPNHPSMLAGAYAICPRPTNPRPMRAQLGSAAERAVRLTGGHADLPSTWVAPAGGPEHQGVASPCRVGRARAWTMHRAFDRAARLIRLALRDKSYDDARARDTWDLLLWRAPSDTVASELGSYPCVASRVRCDRRRIGLGGARADVLDRPVADARNSPVSTSTIATHSRVS